MDGMGEQLRLVAILVLSVISVRSQVQVGEEACNFAFMVDGSGRAAVPGDCTRYIHCDFTETEAPQAFRIDCPDGLFWNPATLVCQYPEDVSCPFDPCLGNPDNTYQLPTDFCGEYWVCSGERTLGKRCCGARESYVPGIGCAANSTCQDSCPREFVAQSLIGCGLIPHQSDDRMFVQLSEDGRSFDMRCALGGLFDPETCECSTHDEDFVPFDPPECVPAFKLTFPRESPMRDYSGYDSDVLSLNTHGDDAMQDTPTGDRGAVFFNGIDSKIISRRFNFAEFGYTPKFNITFLDEGDGSPGEVALLTNYACDLPPTVELYLMPSSSMVGGRILTTVGPLSIQAPYNRNSWNNVILEFDGLRLALDVNGVNTETPSTGNPAKILPMQCSLQIGYGKTMNNFRGHVDEVSITLC